MGNAGSNPWHIGRAAVILPQSKVVTHHIPQDDGEYVRADAVCVPRIELNHYILRLDLHFALLKLAQAIQTRLCFCRHCVEGMSDVTKSASRSSARATTESPEKGEEPGPHADSAGCLFKCLDRYFRTDLLDSCIDRRQIFNKRLIPSPPVSRACYRILPFTEKSK